MRSIYNSMILLRSLEIIISGLFLLGMFTQIILPLLNDAPLFPLLRKSKQKEIKPDDRSQRSNIQSLTNKK